MKNAFDPNQSNQASHFKVLFLTPWYPTHNNPVNGIFIREHAKAANLYDDIVVLHLAGYDRSLRQTWRLSPEADPDLSAGITTFHLSYRLSPLPRTGLLVQYYSLFQGFRTIRKKGFYPDLLHAHIFHTGLPAWLIARQYKIPLIVSEHFTAFPRRLLKKRDTLLARLGFSLADRVLPVCYALQKSIQAYGIQANFQIVPNVADTNIFSPPLQPRVEREIFKLLFVGNLVPIKGFPYLLQALVDLKENQLNWSLDVIGDGPERSRYEKAVQASGLEGKVIFHGVKSKPVIAEFMSRADLFVLPSLWENQPCVLLEAMASGLPALSTMTGGVPEIVSKETGVLVPPGDSPALVQAIRELLGGKIDHYDRFAIAKKAQRYGPEEVGALLHSIYQDVVLKR